MTNFWTIRIQLRFYIRIRTEFQFSADPYCSINPFHCRLLVRTGFPCFLDFICLLTALCQILSICYAFVPYCIINAISQELEKQASEYGTSMDAMQLSLDEIRRQCVDKDTKLEQLRATQEQFEKLEVKSISVSDGCRSRLLLTSQ